MESWQAAFSRRWSFILSATIACALVVIYTVRPDSCAALTFVPSWAWLIAAVFAIPFRRQADRVTGLACTVCWLVFIIAHVEEVETVVRGILNPAATRKPPGVLRLLTQNCGGDARAWADIARLEPDIVFLQEAPPRDFVEDGARRLFGTKGAAVWDGDTCVLAPGPLVPLSAANQLPFASVAGVPVAGVGTVQVVSVHLGPGNMAMDLWSPTAWNAHAALRSQHLEEIRQLVNAIDTPGPWVIAGDFNAPQRDRIFALLPRSLCDSFATVGRGWGNTIVNEMPVLRIDQIWVSRELKPLQSFAVRSTVSDHRSVVTDVKIAGPR